MAEQKQFFRRAGDGEPKGPRIQLFNIVPLLLAFIALVFVLITASMLNRAQAELQSSTKRYVSSQVAASELKNASDNLTTQVRLFAYTGEWKYIKNYFDDTVTTLQRERAMATLSSNLSGTSAESTLQLALDKSNQLMLREFDAMLLVMDAKGYTPGRHMEVLNEYSLTPERQALSPEEKMALAMELVTDAEYQYYDEMIDSNVNNCIGFLSKEQMKTENQLNARIRHLITAQQCFLILLAVMLGISTFMNGFFVIRPLMQNVKLISQVNPLPLTGAFELQYLACAYNIMLAENRKNHDKLTYEAEHDTLTGLYNRGAFNRLRSQCGAAPTAMIHIDVDHFKQINDRYGHICGDRALKKVAGALLGQFRHTDAPCRTGGDEFTVIMNNITWDKRDIVTGKLRQVSKALADTADGLPPITLSIGVAFSDAPHKGEDLYKDADAALYVVKEHGRNGFAFFEGEETEAHSWGES